jgi:DNA-binding CsgD family transcriptional regulator
LAKFGLRPHCANPAIKAGSGYKQIADQLALSLFTLQAHRRHLSGKPGLQGAELVRFAALQNLHNNRRLWA